MSGKNLAQRRNQEPMPEVHLLLEKNLILPNTKVLGVSMVALDMNSSAWGAAALMPGDSHLAQQDAPHSGLHSSLVITLTRPPALEGQPHLIFGEEKEMRENVYQSFSY